MLIFSCFSMAHKASADWEGELKAAFPEAKVVETFDNLQDWGGDDIEGVSGYLNADVNPASFFPQLSQGGLSQWQYTSLGHKAIEISNQVGVFAKYDIVTGAISGAKGGIASARSENGKEYLVLGFGSGTNYTLFTPGETITNSNGASAVFVGYVQWIADHGAENVWRGNGKSLRVNYGDFTSGADVYGNGGILDANYPDNVAGFGPSRLGVFFGDGISGKSGYKKAHVFMMAKLQSNFVQKNPDTGNYLYIGTVKMFDLCSGFTSIDVWGTTNERAQVDPAVNNLHEYGLNFSIYNLIGTGSYGENLFYGQNSFVPTMGGGGYVINQIVANRPTTAIPLYDNVVSPMYEDDEWFGIEMAADIGTIGSNDGTTDFWVYDKNGVEQAHWSEVGQQRLLTFDHYYNKVTLGGNRLCAGYGRCPLGQDNRWFADDIIISDSRIGPSYFAALAAYNNPPATYTIADFLSLVADWLTNNASSDKNSDNIVNTRDLGIIMSNWE